VPATLSPDLRNRAPHLRPWRDGWRHLRYLLMLSPTWVFGVPAMLAMLAALAIFAIAGLHDLGALHGTTPFGTSWQIVAGFLLTVGHFAAIMAVATHFYGVRSGYRQLRPGLARWGHMLTLENALALGMLLIAIAVSVLGLIGIRWSTGGFVALPTVLPLTIGAALGAVGVQTALGGFLLAIISGHQAQFLPPPPAIPDRPAKRSTDAHADNRAVSAHLRRAPGYTAVSIFCALLHNGIMIGLDHLGVYYPLCLTASAAVLLPTGYVLQSRFTFDHAMSRRGFTRYSLALITNYPVSLVTLWVVFDRAHLPMLYAAPLSSAVLFVWNYATSHWALGTGPRILRPVHD
jgi:putative flippase GtrA